MTGMSRECRVLVLNERDLSHPKAGGAEIHVSEIFRRLVSRGYRVTFAASSFPGCTPRDEFHGIEVRRLGRLPFYYPNVARVCRQETRRGAFDVVVECLNKFPFYSTVYASAPVLAVYHHLFGEVAFRQVPWPVAAAVWCAEQLMPPFYRRLPFVTISESSRADLVRRGIPREQIRVSHCGIHRPQIEPVTETPRPQRVAFVGRLEAYKHVDVMLQAMALLSDRFPQAEILVIGRGARGSELERLARDLGLANRTRFTGFVSDRERDELLAGTRVCVFASEKEGWGLTVIESNRLGAPVVASDVEGLRDSVRDGETGFLVKGGDVAGFADRIGTLLADDELATRMSRAALAWSRSFDWERTADDMAEALEEVRSRR
jgi:glycosyltransferase involved in cell wall biosynthesis